MKKYIATLIGSLFLVFGMAFSAHAQSYTDYYNCNCSYGQYGYNTAPYFRDQAHYDNYNFGYNTYPAYNNYSYYRGNYAPTYYQNRGSVVGGIVYGITSALLNNSYYSNQYYGYGGYDNYQGYYGY